MYYRPSNALAVALIAWSTAVRPADELPIDTFTPGIVSTDAVEVGIAFDPDGRKAYFTRYAGRWGRELGDGRLMVTAFDGSAWSEPHELSFSGEHSDSDASLGPDGRLYFVSDRAGAGGDIYAVVRDAGGDWGLPKPIDGAVNSQAHEWSPVVVNSGRLYFASDRKGGFGQGDLYVAEPADEGWDAPRNLGTAINSAGGEWNLFVDPDERFLIFEASGRVRNRSPAGDLWISRRDPVTGDWQAAVWLEELNTDGSDLQPSISPDGTILYFTSTRAANSSDADIYSVPLMPLLDRYGVGNERAGRLLAVSRAGHALHLLDPSSGSGSTVSTGRGPHEVAIALETGRAYVADYGIYPEHNPDPPGQLRFRTEAGGTVSVIDVERMTRIATWRLAQCARPHGIALMPDRSALWVTCEDTRSILALDPAAGQSLRRIEIDREGPHMIRVSPDSRWLAVACVEAGGVAIIDVESGASRWVATGAGAEGIEFSPEGGVLWVLNAADDTVSIVEPASAAIIRTFPSGGRFPIRLQFDRKRQRAWVTNNQSRSVSILDAKTLEPVDTIDIGEIVLGLLIVPEVERAYVSLPRRGQVLALDLESHRAVTALDAGSEVDGLAWVGAR